MYRISSNTSRGFYFQFPKIFATSIIGRLLIEGDFYFLKQKFKSTFFAEFYIRTKRRHFIYKQNTWRRAIFLLGIDLIFINIVGSIGIQMMILMRLEKEGDFYFWSTAILCDLY